MRIKVISAVVAGLFIILCGALGYIQILKYKKYLALSQDNRVRLVPIEGQRGFFFDRNGILLVGNRPAFDVMVIPQELKDSYKTLSRLSDTLGIPTKEVYNIIEKNYTAPFAPILIKEDVDKQKALILEENSLNLPGVMVKVTPKREYKYNEVGSHILGYLGEIDRNELEKLRGYGYQIKDLVGKDGLEKSYDNYLRGEEGGMQLEVNSKGFFVKPLGKKEALMGRDLGLTIDIRLQEFIDKLFADKRGACVVLEASTGEVLALVSKPNFDPNIFLSSRNNDEKREILQRPDRPMLNRAISGLYAPGSVFKPVIAVAGLDRGKIDVNDTFFCGGKYTLGKSVFKCWDEEGHGTENVCEGLKNSCNVFFYQLGRVVGVDDIFAFAARLGYGAPCGIDLPEEASGLIPNRMWKRLARKEAWFEGDTVNYSIGQGYVLVTPLQVVRMMAAIGNGGNLVQPYIVKKIEGVEVAAAKSRNIGISKKTLDIVKVGLTKVIEDASGTGRRAKVEGLRIAGKTGTAQNPSGTSHAWFSGFSPIQAPKIAIVVFVEQGGKGGMEAAEFAGKIFVESKKLGIL